MRSQPGTLAGGGGGQLSGGEGLVSPFLYLRNPLALPSNPENISIKPPSPPTSCCFPTNKIQCKPLNIVAHLKNMYVRAMTRFSYPSLFRCQYFTPPKPLISPHIHLPYIMSRALLNQSLFPEVRHFPRKYVMAEMWVLIFRASKKYFEPFL